LATNDVVNQTLRAQHILFTAPDDVDGLFAFAQFAGAIKLVFTNFVRLSRSVVPAAVVAATRFSGDR
jgi:hypothetical protein